MIDLKIALCLSIGLLVYYLIFQIFSDIMRAGMRTETPNINVAKLMADYQVNIRTFQKNTPLRGFAWFNSIWLNESLFFRNRGLMFTFHHEYYHLKHHHKAYTLLIRLGFSLLPLLLMFLHWTIFTCIVIVAALLINHISKRFEDKANDYAKNKLVNESTTKKGKDYNK